MKMVTTAYDLLTKEQVDARLNLTSVEFYQPAHYFFKGNEPYIKITETPWRDIAQLCVKEIRKWGFLATKRKEKDFFGDSVWVVYAAKKPVSNPTTDNYPIRPDHSLVERIAQEVGTTQFAVWWTYHANFHEPVIVVAKNPEDAFRKVFPSNADAHDPDFKKYVVRLKTGADLVVLP